MRRNPVVTAFRDDANGNMIRWVEGGVTCAQTWDVDNQLTEVVSDTQHTHYFYDVGGALLKRVNPQDITASYAQMMRSPDRCRCWR